MARRFLIAGALVLSVSAGRAFADDPSEVASLRAQLRTTVLQLRELQDQQAAASARPPAPQGPDEGSLKRKLAAAQGALHAARLGEAGAQAALLKAQAENAALTGAAATNAAELEKSKSAYGEAADAGRALAAERDQLKAQLAVTTNIAAACQAKNVRLTRLAEQVLADYERVGFGHILAAREPVLGLRRVQLENIAQEREDTVRANRCDPRLDAKPGKRPAPGG